MYSFLVSALTFIVLTSVAHSQLVDGETVIYLSSLVTNGDLSTGVCQNALESSTVAVMMELVSDGYTAVPVVSTPSSNAVDLFPSGPVYALNTGGSALVVVGADATNALGGYPNYNIARSDGTTSYSSLYNAWSGSTANGVYDGNGNTCGNWDQASAGVSGSIADQYFWYFTSTTCDSLHHVFCVASPAPAVSVSPAPSPSKQQCDRL
jgi:hypothetical protein